MESVPECPSSQSTLENSRGIGREYRIPDYNVTCNHESFFIWIISLFEKKGRNRHFAHQHSWC
jgi:hypothetical protein